MLKINRCTLKQHRSFLRLTPIDWRKSKKNQRITYPEPIPVLERQSVEEGADPAPAAVLLLAVTQREPELPHPM